jgi:hypothetical protein
MWYWFAVYVVVLCIYLLIYEGVVSAVIFSTRFYRGLPRPAGFKPATFGFEILMPKTITLLKAKTYNSSKLTLTNQLAKET